MLKSKTIWLGSLASVAAIAIASAPAAAQQPKNPNIVLILADNLGYGELGVYAAVSSAARPRHVLTRSPVRAPASSTSMLKRSVRRPDRPCLQDALPSAPERTKFRSAASPTD